MKKKYKVISSTEKHFEGIELDYVIDDNTIGLEVKCLGDTYKIIQNGKVLGLVNDLKTLMLLDITPESEVEKPKFIINQNVDIFFETKVIEINDKFGKFTYEEFYEFMKQEWNVIQQVKQIQFPLEYNSETKSLFLKDRWNLIGFTNLTEGCFVRFSEDGRQI